MQLEDMNSWAEEEMDADTASREALQQAQAENLTLLVPNSKMGYSNKTGYTGVSFRPNRSKPYQAGARRGGKTISLGYFTTAEEAALCVARSPEGQAAAEERAAALTSEEARQQAQAEGLMLVVAKNSTGYFGVYLTHPGRPKPYQAAVWRGGKQVSLGYFATAEEAALCVARSPEGQAAAGRAAAALAAAQSRGALPAVPSGAIPRETGTAPAMAPGAEPVVKVEALLLLLKDDDLELDECIGWHGRDNALLVKEEEGSADIWPKRQRGSLT